MSSPRSRTRMGIRLLVVVTGALLVYGAAFGQHAVPPPIIPASPTSPLPGSTAAGSIVGPGVITTPVAVTSGGTTTLVGGTQVTFGTAPPNGYTPAVGVFNGKLILDGTPTGNIGPIAINNTPLDTTIRHVDGIDVDPGGSGATGGVLTSLETVGDTATTIVTTGTNSYGLYASAEGTAGLANMNVNNITITTHGPGSSGLIANQSAVDTANNMHIETFGDAGGPSGEGSYGIGAQFKGNVNISNSTIDTHGSLGIGVVALFQASVNANGLTVTTDSTDANGAYIYGNSVATFAGTTMTTKAANTAGVISDGSGDTTSAAQTSVTGSNLNIVTQGSGSFGAYSFSGAPITLTGGSVSTSGTGAHGLCASCSPGDAPGAITTNGTAISTTGDNAHGAYAVNGGTLQLTGGSVTTTGTNSYGVYGDSRALPGASVLTMDGVTINTQGPGSTGFDVRSGTAVVSNVHVETSGGLAPNGVGSYGFAVLSDVTGGNLTVSNSTFETTGSGAVGAFDWNANLTGNGLTITTHSTDAQGVYAFANATATFSNTTINTAGAGSTGIVADGSFDDPAAALSSIIGNALSITTAGSGTFGADAFDGGTINLTGGSVGTSGTGAHALCASCSDEAATVREPLAPGGLSRSRANVTPGTITANGTAISTTGDNAHGAYAVNGGTLELTGGTSVTTTGTNSYGVYANSQSVPGTSVLKMDNVTVNTQGPGSAGLVVRDGAADVSNVHVTTSGDLDTKGLGSHGLAVESDVQGGSLTISNSAIETKGSGAVGAFDWNANLTGNGLTITTHSTDAQGVYAFANATASLTGTTINTAGPGSTGIVADGSFDDPAAAPTSITGSALNITTAGGGAFGADAFDGGTIILTGGSVGTSAANTHALCANCSDEATTVRVAVAPGGLSRSRSNVTPGTITATGTAISTTGNSAYGAFAANGGNISILGGSITTGVTGNPTHGTGSYGVYASGGNAVINLSDSSKTTITTYGNDSIGALADSSGTISFNGDAMVTSGTAAHGAAVAGSGSLQFSGSNTITTTGGQAHGIAALNGGQLAVDSALQAGVTTTVEGGGSAVYAALGTANGAASTVSMAGGTTVKNGGDFANTIGVLAQDGGAANFAPGSGVTMSADGVIGAEASGSGSQLTGTSATFAVNGTNARGVQADTSGTATLNGGSVTAAGGNAYGVLSTQGGSATLTDVNVSTTGDGGYGVVVEGPTSTVSLNGSNSVSTTGAGAHGLVALNGGQATVTSTLQTALGAKVSGNGSAVVAAIGTDGASSPTRSTVKVQDVTLQNGGNVPNTIGALAQDGGLVSFASGSGVAMNADNVIGARSTGTGAEVTATDATVAITGNNARGMQADNGGTVTLSGGTVTATGTNTYGVLSTQAGNAALNGATISTTGNGAYGAVVEGSSSTMSLTGTNTVNTNGPTAHAVVALNGGQLTIKSGAVNATMQGADSAALAAIGRDAVSGTASTINTSSAAVASAMDHTIGVLALGGGVANLSGGSVAMSGNTSVGLIATGTGSLISTVQGTTVDTTGSGSYAAAVGNGGTLNIDGSKVTATGPNANALLVVGSSNTATFTNTTLSSALSDTLLVSGGSGTINLVDGTTTTSGTGKNLLHAMADASGNASNAVLNLKNVQLAGDILVDADGSNADVHLVDSILTGKMTNAGAVTLDPSTWVVTGNSDVKTLALTNSVVAFQPVSLQNGYKSLLVRGDYTSANGTVVMNTLLNEGGSLANQFTDRLLINGNASGNTVLRVIPSGSGAFTGLAPPLSNQGISLVQVGGTSSANAFQLEHGYVTVGTPYQYGLYAYGPGSPNGAAETSQKLITGADHWDYRLQNAYVSPVVPPAPDCTVCDGDHGGEAQPNGPVNPGPFPAPDVRPALAPQIPAYLAAPTSLLNASLQDLDSLHRRLGEIRDDQRLDRMHMGEFFARFIGASLDYNSNRTFQGFGFGSKQNYAAAQFGGDVVVVNNDEGTMRVGIVGTLGRLRYVPEAVDGPSQGRINDSSLALTATYQRKSGWYLDGIFTGSLYEGHISTTARGTVSPLNGTGYSASIEGGRPFGSMQGWTLEPQAQLIYQHMNFVDQIDADGIRVSPGQHDFGIARVGARLTRTMGEKNLFTPYLKVNWLQGIATGGYETIGNQNFALGVYGSGFQAGAGGTFTLSQLLSVYADGAWQQEVTAGGFKGWVYSAGLRLAF